MQQRTLCNAEAESARSLPDRSRTAVNRGRSVQLGSRKPCHKPTYRDWSEYEPRRTCILDFSKEVAVL